MQASFENRDLTPRRASSTDLPASPAPLCSASTSEMCWTLILLSSLLSSTSGYMNNKPCPKYGCPLAPPIHETFVPAPPGYTPKCAKPGLTFCESLDRYPQQLIKFLIEKHTVDFENFLRDESIEDFNAFRQIPNYEGVDEVDHDDYDEQGYDYPKPNVPPPELYPQSAALLPPRHNVPLNATNNRYLAVSSQLSNPFVSVSSQQSYSYQLPSSQLRGQYRSSELSRPNVRGSWPRNAHGAGYSSYQNPLLEFAARHARTRAKRQSEPNAVSICPTRSQFVSPKAALNNQGNWMYVVNLEERQRYSQLVKSEICTSDSCDGLCSLPLGYTSKCQQQYVQKRLIALEGSGNRLYTDVFWFPHGCMCQVSLEY